MQRLFRYPVILFYLYLEVHFDHDVVDPCSPDTHVQTYCSNERSDMRAHTYAHARTVAWAKTACSLERQQPCRISECRLKGGAAMCITRATKDGQDKTFNFDHSFWSHDPADPHYSAQQHVFEELGNGVLENAFQVRSGLYSNLRRKHRSFAYTAPSGNRPAADRSEVPSLASRWCRLSVWRLRSHGLPECVLPSFVGGELARAPNRVTSLVDWCRVTTPASSPTARPGRAKRTP